MEERASPSSPSPLSVPSREIAALCLELAGPLASFVQCQQTADDLAQEAFLRACRYYRPSSPPEDLRRWVRTIGFNLARSHVRRASLSDRGLTPVPGLDLTLVAAPEPDPDAAEVSDLHAAVANLPPHLSVPLRSYYFSGIPCREIGKLMGLSHTCVKIRIHRGRAKLRKALGRGQV